MTTGLAAWPEVFAPGARVLVVVNSAPAQSDEIRRALLALEGSCGLDAVSAIAPSAVRPWLLGRGLRASAVLPPRVAGLEVDFDGFLERPETVRWALRRGAGLVVGSQPYEPDNLEVKDAFERRVAPMLGGARFVSHALPSQQVFVLSAEDLWHRAGRSAELDAYRAGVEAGLTGLHVAWASGRGGRPELDAAFRPHGGPDGRPEVAAVRDAMMYAYERLAEAASLREGVAEGEGLRVIVEPPDGWPDSGWLPGSLRPLRRPAQRAPGVRWHGQRLVVRGAVEGPYSYLLMSRPVVLRRGDAVLAEGRVYRGGITVGLVAREQWASRVDIDTPGRFLAAAVAREPGPHVLVVANCLRGAERNNSVVLHRFGWAARS